MIKSIKNIDVYFNIIFSLLLIALVFVFLITQHNSSNTKKYRINIPKIYNANWKEYDIKTFIDKNKNNWILWVPKDVCSTCIDYILFLIKENENIIVKDKLVLLINIDNEREARLFINKYKLYHYKVYFTKYSLINIDNYNKKSNIILFHFNNYEYFYDIVDVDHVNKIFLLKLLK